MFIELQDQDRQIIAALQSKIQDTKARAEASIAAYQESLGMVFQTIIRTAGGGDGNYQLNAAGTALVAIETPPQAQ
jgi:hypothetical protein